MAKSVYSWGKAAAGGKKTKGKMSGVKRPSKTQAPKPGVKKVKKMKTGY